MAVPPEHIDPPEVRLKLGVRRQAPHEPIVRLHPEVVELTRQGREKGLEGPELMRWVDERNPRREDHQARYQRKLLEEEAKKRAYVKEHGCPHYATNGEPYLVYFVQERDGAEGPIKIGRVTAHPTKGKGALFHVKTRASTLQSCNPRRLVILGWTYQHRELDVQARFAHLRIRGEWFRPAAELLVFIEEVCDDDEA